MPTLPFSTAPLTGLSTIPLGGLRPNDNNALQNYMFTFTNGDHHIQRIRLIKGTNEIAAAFKDKNDDDPWTLTGCYLDVPGTSSSISFALPDGQVRRIGIPGMTANTRFALSGFDFDFGGNEQHIQSITVLPNEADGTVLVGFKDKDAGETVRVTLQFVLVPVERVGGEYRQSGDNMRLGTNRVMDNPRVGAAESRVLSGFSFVYLFRTDGGDAHLLNLGVDPTTHTVAFQDNDFHEIIQWNVDYFALR